MTVDTSRPVCENCGTLTVRARTKWFMGRLKGSYSCPNPECPDSFKVWYRRGSKTTGIAGARE